MKKYLKNVVLSSFLVFGYGAFAQVDNGYDLPILDNMTFTEEENEEVWVDPIDVTIEENSNPSLDLSDELPKLDEMLQVYFGGAEDFVIEQELDEVEEENMKDKIEKPVIHEPLMLYPIDHGYDLPEMDSIDIE